MKTEKTGFGLSGYCILLNYLREEAIDTHGTEGPPWYGKVFQGGFFL